MGLKEDLDSNVKDIFATKWTKRSGTVVPQAEDVALGNDAVTFDEAVVLYADLAQSTALVNSQADHFAAEIYKAFLHCASKIISKMEGEITAFDGDRVMAVFLGNAKRSNAAKCGLGITYAVREIINPAIKKEYPTSTYQVGHAVGIDVSKLFVARTGIRGSNDLVWVGRAANYAAKLATVRDGTAVWITADVYNRLDESAKFGGNPRQDIWEKRVWASLPGIEIYRSTWQRSP